MNKFLMLSAAAALATSTADTIAGTLRHSFNFCTASGNSCFVDGGIVYTSGRSVWSWQHVHATGAPSYGQGLAGKRQGTAAKSVNMSDTFYGQNYGIFSLYLNYELPAKLRTGQPYEVWFGMAGTTSFIAGAGTISVTGSTGSTSIHRIYKSTTDGLKQLIQTHRAASKDR